MSDKTISVRTTTADMLSKIDSAQLANEANRLMKFGPYPNITAAEAAQLVMYGRMIDANPWNGEVYPTPKGPMNGVMLYRRKAKEYNQRMAPTGETWDYKISYRLAESHEADYDPEKGDVAWMCELTDTQAEKEWQDAYVRFFNLLVAAKAPYEFADQKATRMAGTRPVWSAVGVVGGSEHFSAGEVDEWGTNASGKKYPKTYKKDANGDDIYAQEMWDRNERAKKRAEKQALKKRYPDMLIPEFQELWSRDMEVKIMNAVGDMERAEAVTPERAAQTMKDLGLEPDSSMVVDAVSVEDVPMPPPPPTPDPVWNVTHAVDLYTTVTDSKGVAYAEKTVDALSYSLNALNKKIKDAPHDTEEEIAALEQMKLKRDACLYYINQKKG